MSLDFQLVKSHGHPLTLEEIDQDTSFKAADYRELGERFFGPVTWTGVDGIADHSEMSFELSPTDVSLHVTARGLGDTVQFMDDVARTAFRDGVVVIDIQGSELLLPLSD
ncbi:MAG: hypothetical protein EOP84_05000 [Verrucomicrobiaceae bacterium]|nr:MAG: hypothetical protein EOP84_05000 [Verrucomicrobiaceae bacterium]